ncbi:hypothetical protein Taro_050316 [Colocasia esculenta]|uniref:Protein kinase domain-containing protein n=1 Tax=Colocasia esculenta TaxID=4460 RepID=A0A843XDE9_COLES|nr:hypothetical protein [Colocasia esculenta]
MGIRPLFWLLLLTPLVVLSEQEDVKNSLLIFLRALSANDSRVEHDLGWNTSTDPCSGVGWKGINCNQRTNSTRRIFLHDLQLRGSIDAGPLCRAPSLVFVSITGNNLHGGIPPEISECTGLTHLLLPGNRLSGSLPSSLSTLNNLKKFDISDNRFVGTLPDVGRISGLLVFLAQNNNLSGEIPQLQFSNLQQFNVSHNRFYGPVPAEAGRFGLSSLAGNSGLCGGLPSLPACQPPPSASPGEKQGSQHGEKLVMYLGYVLLGVAILAFSAFKVITRKKRTKRMVKKEKKEEAAAAAMAIEQGEGLSTSKKSSTGSMGSGGGQGAGGSRSEFSISSTSEGSAEMGSGSLVVLRNPSTSTTKELKFRELLKAPAVLVGRGRHGSVYKAMLDDGRAVAVKRLKDGGVPGPEEFRRRMERVDHVGRHSGVLPALAFYCSNQEKLVVYEYQARGSLFNLLHGIVNPCALPRTYMAAGGQNNGQQAFDWSSRLSAAAGICECLAYMHQELHGDGIAHGSLKSSNVLLDDHMHPRISEYGLSTVSIGEDPFAADVHGFGVILLELLTGKVVEGSGGLDLAQWVNSVVREEWTGEVFDGGLLRDESANVERMFRLLQVALKCIGSSPGARPDMKQVAAMVGSIMEDEERSCTSSAVSDTGGDSR